MARDDKNVLHMVPHQSAYNQMRRHSTTLEQGKDGVSKLNPSPQLEQQRAQSQQVSIQTPKHEPVISKKELSSVDDYCKSFEKASGVKLEVMRSDETLPGHIFPAKNDVYTREGRFVSVHDNGKFATGYKLVKYSRELEAWREKDVEMRYRDNKQLEVKAMEKSRDRGMER